MFFLVDHRNPEILPAVGAEELWEILEGIMLQSFVGVGLINSVHIQAFDDPRSILLVRAQV